MKLADYARKVGVSYKTAWRWWKSGTLNGYQLPSGTIVIQVDDPNVPQQGKRTDLETCPVCDATLNRATQASIARTSIYPYPPLSKGGPQHSKSKRRCQICGWQVTLHPPSPREQVQIDWARQMWATQGQKSKSDSVSLSGLKTRLDELQAQLLQATAERGYLRSQLERLLNYLEQANLESIQPALCHLEAHLSELQGETNNRWSEVGMDYSPLFDRLSGGNWQEADELTWDLMLKAMGRESEGWLRPEDLVNFPCQDLLALDWLWQEHSGGRFGFGVQQWIWQGVGENYTEFCDRVGWRRGDNWKYYQDLSFSLNAPEGHLPIVGWRKRACYGLGEGTAAEAIAALGARLSACSQPEGESN